MPHVNNWTLQAQNAQLPAINVGDSYDVLWYFQPGQPGANTSDWDLTGAPKAHWTTALGNTFSTALISGISGDTTGWRFHYQIYVNGVAFPQLSADDPVGGSFNTYITPTVPDPGFGQFSSIPWQACDPSIGWDVFVRITNIGTTDYPGNWFGMTWQIGIGTVCPTTPSITNDGKPFIVTTASIDGSGKIQDQAVLSDGAHTPTGTITFDLYGPDDVGCASSIIHTETVSVSGNGTYNTSTGYTPVAAGMYQWIATYSGDVWNIGNETACGDTDEQVTVVFPGLAHYFSNGGLDWLRTSF